MKTSLLIGGLAALVLAAGGAVAQQAPERPAAGPARADADGDGRISQAEFVGRRLERLRAADADGDGAVSAEERGAARQAHRATRMAARFDRLDADRDGVLSRAEFETARGGARTRAHGRNAARPMRAASPVAIADAEARLTQAFARLDTDGDGYVTQVERRAARAASRANRRAPAAQASPSAPASE